MKNTEIEMSKILFSVRCLGVEESLTPDRSYGSYQTVAKMSVVVDGAPFFLEMVEEDTQIQRFDADPQDSGDQRRFEQGKGWNEVRNEVQLKVFGQQSDDYDLFEDITFIAVTLPEALSDAAREAADAYGARRLVACGQLARRTGQPRWIM